MKPGYFLHLLCVVMLGLASCSKPQAPQYLGYQNFRMERLGLSNTVLSTNVKLYNPNRYPLQLKSASLDVYFNDAFLGHSSFDSLLTLPAQDTAYVPLRLQAAAKDLLAQSAKLLLNPDVRVKISGNAKAGRSGFFVNVPINYEGVQRIDLLKD